MKKFEPTNQYIKKVAMQIAESSYTGGPVSPAGYAEANWGAYWDEAIEQIEKEEDPILLITENIEKFSGIGDKLKNSRLKQKAIVLLLQDITKMNRGDIETVLDALPKLKERFLK